MPRLYLLLLLFFSSSVWAEESSVQCKKLMDLMRQTAQLDERFSQIVGDIDAREKAFLQSWEKKTAKEREYAEQECEKVAVELEESLSTFTAPEKKPLRQPQEKPADFPVQCEEVITLSLEVKTLLDAGAGEIEKIEVDQLIRDLEQNMFDTWSNTDLIGQQKMINACAESKSELDTLIKEAKEKQQ